MCAIDVSHAEQLSERQVVFTRVIGAPREVAWEAWTDPRHLHAWYGPAGFTTTTQAFSFTADGEWRFVMHSPDGRNYENRIVFREIDPPSRIVHENWWEAPGLPSQDFTVVVEFAAEGTRTRFSMQMTFRDEATFRAAVDQYGVLHGGTQTLDRISAYVEGLRRSPRSRSTL